MCSRGGGGYEGALVTRSRPTVSQVVVSPEFIQRQENQIEKKKREKFFQPYSIQKKQTFAFPVDFLVISGISIVLYALVCPFWWKMEILHGATRTEQRESQLLVS